MLKKKSNDISWYHEISLRYHDTYRFERDGRRMFTLCEIFNRFVCSQVCFASGRCLYFELQPLPRGYRP